MIMKAHNKNKDMAASSTSYYDFDGVSHDDDGPLRVALSNRAPANFKGVSDAVFYELVLHQETLRLTKSA